MAMGTVIKKTLGDGEQILVDGNSILCFESSVTVDVRPVGNIAAVCCGGEGIFNTELTGECVHVIAFVLASSWILRVHIYIAIPRHSF